MAFLLQLFVGLLFDDFRLSCIVCFPSDVLISGHASPLQHDMKQGQVAEEQKSTEVEEASDGDEDRKFNHEEALVCIFVRLDSWFCLCV